MRALFFVIVLALLLPVAAATGEGPIKGSCIAQRGLTGFAITLENCKPDLMYLHRTVLDLLCATAGTCPL